MKISTFLLFDSGPPGAPAVDPLARGLELCRAADELGFDTVWVAEHHFDGPGVLPNPAVFLAAAATVTTRVRLGPAVAVLPFRHPAITAENYALVDRLSGGRLEMGVGSGAVASEFAGLGLDVTSKQPLFDESLDALRRLWSGETVSQYALNALPLQSPPRVYLASQRPEAARAAGRRGLSLLTLASPELDRLEAIELRLQEHRRGLEEQGLEPAQYPRAVALLAGVGADAASARATIEPHLSAFARAQGIPLGGDETLYDRMREQGTAAFGDPAEVARTLGRLQAMGADEAILWICFAGMPAPVVIDSMRRVRDSVRPLLDRSAPATH